ncbi:MAG: transglutaminase domain-containing protein [Sedimentisphaerales bacterium]
MRELRCVLVLFVVSLIHAGVDHAQGNPIHGLHSGTIVGVATSPLAGTGGSEIHLINNKGYRSKVESAFREREQLAHNRKEILFGVFKSGLSLQQEEALKFLFAYMPLSDLADYDGDFFLANANIALKTRQESSWGKSIPEDIFLHYVLPCRVDDEHLDSFRIAYYDEIQRRVKGMDAKEAALEINHWCHEKATYQSSGSRNTGPITTMLSAQGRCGMLSIFAVASLRTAGIPARSVSALWAHNDDDHAWVEVWIDGKWHYMEACEPEPVLDWAWFTEEARRAMLIVARSFGAKYGQNNIMECYRNYCLVNTLSKYAVTKTIKVRVLDTDNVPVKDALVEYLLYTSARFYPLAEVPTDEFGISRFETGLGDLLIWARRGDDFNFKKVSVNEIDTLDLVLNLKPADDGVLDLDLGIPVERAPLKGPATELIAVNTKRTNAEDVIRQAYIDSWMKPEEAANLAKELGANPEIVKDIIRRSMGNYKSIVSFLTHTPASDRPLAINLLKQVSDQDLRETKEEILADHLDNVIRFENTHGAYDYELYSKYVLNPSIANTMIATWRKYLYESMPAGFRQDAISDPSILIKYVNNNIVIADNENYWKPPISLKGVNELRVSDSYHRDIYFVALCRSLGIPSRLWLGSNGYVPQYYFRGEWHDAWLAGKNQPLLGKGFVRLSSKDPAQWFGGNFSITHFENGKYYPIRQHADIGNEVALAPGHYMLLTGYRGNDSKILATLSFFELKENEHKTIDIKLRRWSHNTTGVGLYRAALLGDVKNVKRLIQAGSDVDRKDEWGWTALYWAVRGNQKEVVEFLIAKGANVNAKGEKGLTLLHLAVRDNQT